MTENKGDEPLYKCIIKKSVSVTKEVGRFLKELLKTSIKLILIGMAIIAVILFINSVASLVSAPLRFVLGGMVEFLTGISLLTYTLLFCIIAIPAYSTAWCLLKRSHDKAEKKNQMEDQGFNCQED